VHGVNKETGRWLLGRWGERGKVSTSVCRDQKRVHASSDSSDVIFRPGLVPRVGKKRNGLQLKNEKTGRKKRRKRFRSQLLEGGVSLGVRVHVGDGTLEGQKAIAFLRGVHKVTDSASEDPKARGLHRRPEFDKRDKNRKSNEWWANLLVNGAASRISKNVGNFARNLPKSPKKQVSRRQEMGRGINREKSRTEVLSQALCALVTASSMFWSPGSPSPRMRSRKASLSAEFLGSSLLCCAKNANGGYELRSYA